MEFRARRSGFQLKIPSAFPDSKNDNISANFIRPGSLAVWASQSEATISRFSLAANSFNSEIWDSMLKICRSSLSVDFLA
ncbi:MAG: hypothetical protein HYW65_04770 [Candidatus Liptonbacteria bacterium]|nr:hypothetical protein [Candidatus Liptonbacteria bacterium]